MNNPIQRRWQSGGGRADARRYSDGRRASLVPPPRAAVLPAMGRLLQLHARHVDGQLAHFVVRLQTANQFYVVWKILLLVARALQWSSCSWRKFTDSLGDMCGAHGEREERGLMEDLCEELLKHGRASSEDEHICVAENFIH